jgi:4-hydroxy-3-methylbut-2-enyl diphosphate reductase
MKQFEIPSFYKSPIISKVKALRKDNDPRKKDFTPTLLDFGPVRFYIARHFGFCYGVENAIEISYKAISENPGKRIFLISEMIHNPAVNADLLDNGIRFLQDTDGTQLIPWSELTPEDVVLIPAFGTTVDIENILQKIGVNIERYNTTCPFVEKVWNRSEKLGKDKHTIIIHGKYNHEETRATFSHSAQNSSALIVKDMSEAKFLGNAILGKCTKEEFTHFFDGKCTANFSFENDLEKIGVVNQTTMLATETQEITDYLREVMIQKYGEVQLKDHIADTRDTLCYATNDNQSATYGLMDVEADFAIVVGGHNSSNTTHLVELLEQKFSTYFIESEHELINEKDIRSYDIHSKTVRIHTDYFKSESETPTIIITSGASCPDAVVDRVIQRILEFTGSTYSIEQVLENLH